jgi:hypothetical protein
MDRICDSDTASGRANQAVLDIAARLRACLSKTGLEPWNWNISVPLISLAEHLYSNF